MTSASKGILRPFLIVCIILACFMVCLFIYIKPTNSWIFSPMESASSVLKMKFLLHQKLVILMKTTILIWVWPFGQTFDLTSCQAMFTIQGCHLTTDRSSVQQVPRSSDPPPRHQLGSDQFTLSRRGHPSRNGFGWIWSHRLTIITAEEWHWHLFNLTLTYRRDSDIQVPYGFLTVSTNPFVFEVPNKVVSVLVVSNWNPEHARVKYYNELSKSIEIHTYGQAFGEYVIDKILIPTIFT